MTPEKNCCSVHTTVEESAAPRSRQHGFVHEHRFIRSTNNTNRMFTTKKMWINTIFCMRRSASNYDEEEVKKFYVDLEKFYRDDRTFFKIIIGDFNAKIGPRKTFEERYIGNPRIRSERAE
ncbi:unnamed protein product [Angiostrongylus costaricensis]|uniref:Craniofacial development protein 2-like n=1 Tax=Angiostrongylus costaricensis TaxID=334426 RepID=A0A0R3Q1D9_ANGCS|nr:unnamed protein product [Angiostrongylus costaricensis]